MRIEAELHPLADRDINDIAAYLCGNSRNAAERFLESCLNAIQEIATRPTWAAHADDFRFPGLRRKAVKGFKNYYLFYRVSEKKLIILRVLHGARDIAACLDEVWED